MEQQQVASAGAAAHEALTAGAEANASADVNHEQATQPAEQSVDGLKANHDRLLAERKRDQDRARKAEKELRSLKEAALKEEGKAVERAKYWEEKYRSLHETTVTTSIRNAIEAQARSLGCETPEAVVKLANYDLIDYDEQTGQVTGQKDVAEDVRRQYPSLFAKAATPTINPSLPAGAQSFNNKEDYSKLSVDEIKSRLKQLYK